MLWLLSYFRSWSIDDLTPILKLHDLWNPNGIHENPICQQCRSRVIEIDDVVSFRVMRSKPPWNEIPHLGVRLTLPLNPIVWFMFLRYPVVPLLTSDMP